MVQDAPKPAPQQPHCYDIQVTLEAASINFPRVLAFDLEENGIPRAEEIPTYPMASNISEIPT